MSLSGQAVTSDPAILVCGPANAPPLVVSRFGPVLSANFHLQTWPGDSSRFSSCSSSVWVDGIAQAGLFQNSNSLQDDERGNACESAGWRGFHASTSQRKPWR